MRIKDGRMTISRTRKIPWRHFNEKFVVDKVRFVNWLKAYKICKRGVESFYDTRTTARD